MTTCAAGNGSDRGRTAAATVVLVASDVRLYREGLVDILGTAFHRVEGAEDRSAAVDASARAHVDVVLVDLAMEDAYPLIRELAARGTTVVALGVREVEADVIACAEGGVAGYVTREAAAEELVDVVRGVSRGESPCSPRIAALLLQRVTAAAERPSGDGAGRLTPREIEIVRLIDEGLSNKQIARRLSIELATVKNHVHSILDKLKVHRRGEAAALARRAGY